MMIFFTNRKPKESVVQKVSPAAGQGQNQTPARCPCESGSVAWCARGSALAAAADDHHSVHANHQLWGERCSQRLTSYPY